MFSVIMKTHYALTLFMWNVASTYVDGYVCTVTCPIE